MKFTIINLFFDLIKNATIEIFLTLSILSLLLYSAYLTFIYPHQKVSDGIRPVSDETLFGMVGGVLVLGGHMAFVSCSQFSSNESATLFSIFVADHTTQAFKCMMALIAAAITYLMYSSHLYQRVKVENFLALYLFAVLGCCLLISANDFVFLFISLEIVAYSFYLMCGLGHISTVGESSLRYILIGAFGSFCYVVGCLLLYKWGAISNLDELCCLLGTLGVAQPEIANHSSLYIGQALMVFGVLSKLGVTPFFFLMTDAYFGTLLSASIAFTTLPKIPYLFVALKLCCGGPLLHLTESGLATATFIGMVVSVLVAFTQPKLKRFYIVSSVAQVAFTVLGLLENSVAAFSSVLIFTLSYTFLSLAFWGLYLIICQNNSYKWVSTDVRKGWIGVGKIGGLLKENVVVAFIFLIVGFTLAGLPSFLTFFSKFITIMAFSTGDIGSGTQLLYSLIVVLASSGIAVFYYIQLIKLSMFETSVAPDAPSRSTTQQSQPSAALEFFSLGFALLSVIFFFEPSCLVNFCETFIFGHII